MLVISPRYSFLLTPPASGLFLLLFPILACQLLAVLRSGDHSCSIVMCALADALRLQSVCSQFYVSLCVVGGLFGVWKV